MAWIIAGAGSIAETMATIRISVDESATYSIFEIEGEVAVEDIISAMERQYVESTPRHALWDYSKASFHKLDTADYTRIAATAKRLAVNRKGGHTAFVAPGDLESVALKLLEASASLIELPIALRICETRDEAVAWLTADTP